MGKSGRHGSMGSMCRGSRSGEVGEVGKAAPNSNTKSKSKSRSSLRYSKNFEYDLLSSEVDMEHEWKADAVDAIDAVDAVDAVDASHSSDLVDAVDAVEVVWANGSGVNGDSGSIGINGTNNTIRTNGAQRHSHSNPYLQLQIVQWPPQPQQTPQRQQQPHPPRRPQRSQQPQQLGQTPHQFHSLLPLPQQELRQSQIHDSRNHAHDVQHSQGVHHYGHPANMHGTNLITNNHHHSSTVSTHHSHPSDIPKIPNISKGSHYHHSNSKHPVLKDKEIQMNSCPNPKFCQGGKGGKGDKRYRLLPKVPEVPKLPKGSNLNDNLNDTYEITNEGSNDGINLNNVHEDNPNNHGNPNHHDNHYHHDNQNNHNNNKMRPHGRRRKKYHHIHTDASDKNDKHDKSDKILGSKLMSSTYFLCFMFLMSFLAVAFVASYLILDRRNRLQNVHSGQLEQQQQQPFEGGILELDSAEEGSQNAQKDPSYPSHPAYPSETFVSSPWRKRLKTGQISQYLQRRHEKGEWNSKLTIVFSIDDIVNVVNKHDTGTTGTGEENLGGGVDNTDATIMKWENIELDVKEAQMAIGPETLFSMYEREGLPLGRSGSSTSDTDGSIGGSVGEGGIMGSSGSSESRGGTQPHSLEYSILVSDRSDRQRVDQVADATSDKIDFAVLLVNHGTHQVHGLVREMGGQMIRIHYTSGGRTSGDEWDVSDGEAGIDRWSKASKEIVGWNGVNEEDDELHELDELDDEEITLHASERSENYGNSRFLKRKRDHDDQHSKEQANGQKNRQKEKDINAMRGDAGRDYHHQINLYLEIDSDFVQQLASDEEEPLKQAIQYINILFTAANILLEREVMTHLNVVRVHQTDLYDDDDDDNENDEHDEHDDSTEEEKQPQSPQQILNKMQSTYGGKEWHVPGIGLHYSLLGRDCSSGNRADEERTQLSQTKLGPDDGDGGVSASPSTPSIAAKTYKTITASTLTSSAASAASKPSASKSSATSTVVSPQYATIENSLCNPRKGFGVVTGPWSGSGTSVLGDGFLEDLKRVVQTIGYSFGAGSTQDDNYDPPVDTCRPKSCPANSENVTGWATIMSQCDTSCSGGMENILFTFGGYYSGTGDANNVENWINEPNLEGKRDVLSCEPRRVPHQMYSFISSRTKDCFVLDDSAESSANSSFNNELIDQRWWTLSKFRVGRGSNTDSNRGSKSSKADGAKSGKSSKSAGRKKRPGRLPVGPSRVPNPPTKLGPVPPPTGSGGQPSPSSGGSSGRFPTPSSSGRGPIGPSSPMTKTPTKKPTKLPTTPQTTPNPTPRPTSPSGPSQGSTAPIQNIPTDDTSSPSLSHVPSIVNDTIVPTASEAPTVGTGTSGSEEPSEAPSTLTSLVPAVETPSLTPSLMTNISGSVGPTFSSAPSLKNSSSSSLFPTLTVSPTTVPSTPNLLILPTALPSVSGSTVPTVMSSNDSMPSSSMGPTISSSPSLLAPSPSNGTSNATVVPTSSNAPSPVAFPSSSPSGGNSTASSLPTLTSPPSGSNSTSSVPTLINSPSASPSPSAMPSSIASSVPTFLSSNTTSLPTVPSPPSSASTQPTLNAPSSSPSENIALIIPNGTDSFPSASPSEASSNSLGNTTANVTIFPTPSSRPSNAPSLSFPSSPSSNATGAPIGSSLVPTSTAVPTFSSSATATVPTSVGPTLLAPSSAPSQLNETLGSPTMSPLPTSSSSPSSNSPVSDSSQLALFMPSTAPSQLNETLGSPTISPLPTSSSPPSSNSSVSDSSQPTLFMPSTAPSQLNETLGSPTISLLPTSSSSPSSNSSVSGNQTGSLQPILSRAPSVSPSELSLNASNVPSQSNIPTVTSFPSFMPSSGNQLLKASASLNRASRPLVSSAEQGAHKHFLSLVLSVLASTLYLCV